MSNRLSIRRQLLVSLLGAVSLTAAGTVWLAYQSARKEVHRLFDSGLAQEAIVLAKLLNHEADEEQRRARDLKIIAAQFGQETIRKSPLFERMLQQNTHTSEHKDYIHLLAHKNFPDYPYHSRIHFFARYPGGQVMVRSPQTKYFAADHSGFQTVARGGENWRVYTFIMPDTHLLVQLSEQMELRKLSVGNWLNHALWPLFLMIPVLGLIIWLSVGNAMARLRRVADVLEQRDPYSLELISVRHAPEEIVPLVVALNHLFQRVDAALENEHEFTSNAAHELRNPLAALKTRIQAFQIRVTDPDEIHFLHDLSKGVDRISHLLLQMLILARADTRQRQDVYDPVDLMLLAESVLAEQAHLGLEKDIDLSLEGDSALVNADAESVRILLANLLENAIKYTPRGGKIVVRVLRHGQQVELQVEDDGPGIPPEQREALFQRFKRGSQQRTASGSGLGLAIVRRIAELHAATVTLQTPSSGKGLLVSVIFSLIRLNSTGQR